MENYEKIQLTSSKYLSNRGLDGKLAESKYYKTLSLAQNTVHSTIPSQNFSSDEIAFFETGTREEIFNKINPNRAVIFLMSNGCEWALKSAHGCTMCGHLAKQIRGNKSIPSQHYVSQFEKIF